MDALDLTTQDKDRRGSELEQLGSKHARPPVAVIPTSYESSLFFVET
jgi:hypothetical protein